VAEAASPVGVYEWAMHFFFLIRALFFFPDVCGGGSISCGGVRVGLFMRARHLFAHIMDDVCKWWAPSHEHALRPPFRPAIFFLFKKTILKIFFFWKKNA
jgi:hypothetical protein